MVLTTLRSTCCKGLLGLLLGSKLCILSVHCALRFLPRLLLVHGTLADYRLVRLIKYSFYKNITFAMVFFFYQFFNGVSGQVRARPLPPCVTACMTAVLCRTCLKHCLHFSTARRHLVWHSR